jgi:DNA polymerase-3 subunit chi
MTVVRVEFHDGPDTVSCAVEQVVAAVADDRTALVVLAADAAQAQMLDARLWDVGESVFLPHTCADDPHAGAARVVIAVPGQPASGRAVVLNLRAEPVALDCERIIELIPADEPGKVAARARWRAYVARGLKPEKR